MRFVAHMGPSYHHMHVLTAVILFVDLDYASAGFGS